MKDPYVTEIWSENFCVVMYFAPPRIHKVESAMSLGRVRGQGSADLKSRWRCISFVRKHQKLSKTGTACLQQMWGVFSTRVSCKMWTYVCIIWCLFAFSRDLFIARWKFIQREITETFCFVFLQNEWNAAVIIATAAFFSNIYNNRKQIFDTKQDIFSSPQMLLPISNFYWS